MIHRGNVLKDVQDKEIDVLIVFCNTVGVWTGYIKQSIKDTLYNVYSTDMKMMNNRKMGGFSYYTKNDLLFINAYVLMDNDDLHLKSLEIFLKDKLKNNIKKIYNREMDECRYGVVLPDYDLSTMEYIDTYMRDYVSRLRLYRFRKND